MSEAQAALERISAYLTAKHLEHAEAILRDLNTIEKALELACKIDGTGKSVALYNYPCQEPASESVPLRGAMCSSPEGAALAIRKRADPPATPEVTRHDGGRSERGT